MRGDVAGRARVGVVAPDAADPLGLLEDREGVDPGPLQGHREPDAAEAGADDRHARRAMPVLGSVPGGRHLRQRAPRPDSLHGATEVDHRLVRLPQQAGAELEVVPHALETGVRNVDALIPQPPYQLVGVAQEEVMGAHLDVRRRHSAELRTQHGELGVQRIRRSAIEVPAPDRPVATEPGVTAAVESHRRTRAGEIEPAVEKCQSRREVLARIPESRRQRDRQASSGRVANDRNRAWIECRGELAIGGQSVLQPRRMRVLRSEPIVEHVHWRPAGDADLSSQPAVGPRGAEYIGAAVQVEDGLLGACAFGDDPVAGSPPEGFLSHGDAGRGPGDPRRRLRPGALRANRNPRALNRALQRTGDGLGQRPWQVTTHGPGE